jgi:hypothetical protein
MKCVMEQNVMERSGLRVEPLTLDLVRDYAVVTGISRECKGPGEAIGRVETAIGRLGTGNTYVRTHLA